MPVLPRGIVNERQIDIAIRKAAKALAPEVVRIRYSLGTDSGDSPAIFFRVLLTDRASKPEGLFPRVERITEKLLEIVQPLDRFGLEAYVNVRSESEQAELQDPVWE